MPRYNNDAGKPDEGRYEAEVEGQVRFRNDDDEATDEAKEQSEPQVEGQLKHVH
jgi:hypothetical protein